MAKEVDRAAQEYQNAVQSLALELKGRPVEEVKPLVSARWRDLGGEITDPELTEVATAIAEGTKINFIRG
ncbi:hypothetical protein ABT299_30235 [Spirillospora sp. NPDC000708]